MIHACVCGANRLQAAILAALLLLAATTARADNIILMIGDGMGQEHIDAASLYVHGERGKMFMESLPVSGWIRTGPADTDPTDSAASATAYAAGRKVSNKVLSLAIPGDGAPLPTILERARDAGWSTGLVSTAYLTHATPAAFGSHVRHRDLNGEVAAGYLETKPDVLLGGGHDTLDAEAFRAAGYAVVSDRVGLEAIDVAAAGRVAGFFGEGHMPYEADGVGDLPHLHEMTRAALDLLARDEDGFFLMVEAGRIDHAGHDNDIVRNVPETVEFDRTIQLVHEWAADRDDTLVLITADHETGGLAVQSGNGAGNLPTVTWSTDQHTAVDVPIFGWGPNADWFDGRTVDNTAVYGVMQATLEAALDNESRLFPRAPRRGRM